MVLERRPLAIIRSAEAVPMHRTHSVSTCSEATKYARIGKINMDY
jgi:hypothetical protein